MAHVIDKNDLSSSVRIALELRHKASMQDIDLLDEHRHLNWCLVVHPKNIGWQQDTAVAEVRLTLLLNTSLLL